MRPTIIHCQTVICGDAVIFSPFGGIGAVVARVGVLLRERCVGERELGHVGSMKPGLRGGEPLDAAAIFFGEVRLEVGPHLVDLRFVAPFIASQFYQAAFIEHE